MSQIVLIAGPNGAGKSTIAAGLLRNIPHFLNADDMERELTVSGSKGAAVTAGRLLLKRWSELEAQGADFAVETTLATRSYAEKIARMQRTGYRFHLLFLWLPNADYAVERVRERVSRGGHNIPEAVIRRRYATGLSNFFQMYRPLADTWTFFDNARDHNPVLVAYDIHTGITIKEQELWDRILEQVNLPS